MAILQVNKVFVTNHLDGDFRVQRLRDLHGNDLSHLVDKEKAFHDHFELKIFLAEKLQIPLRDMCVIGYT